MSLVRYHHTTEELDRNHVDHEVGCALISELVYITKRSMKAL